MKKPAKLQGAAARHEERDRALHVLLVDDHQMLLDVMRRQFESDAGFVVAGVASTMEAAAQEAKRTTPDVVLLDIELGEESGLDLIAVIRKICPQARIVMLSMFNQRVCRDRAFALGADAYVTKGARYERLRALLRGEPEDATDADYIWRRQGYRAAIRTSLSGRELQVLRALANGMLEKEVAGYLGISVSSVSTYLNRAMYKTDCSSRAELMRYASVLGGGE